MCRIVSTLNIVIIMSFITSAHSLNQKTVTGKCIGGTVTWELETEHASNNMFEIDFDIESDSQDKWLVKIFHNGKLYMFQLDKSIIFLYLKYSSHLRN